VTQDGVHRPVDAVICSTGANTDCAPPVPIVAGEYDLSRDWKPATACAESKFGFPYSYLGVGTPGFPNLTFILGPNPAGPTGTLVNSSETQIVRFSNVRTWPTFADSAFRQAYIAKMLRKMSTQGIRTITPSKEATDDFVASVGPPVNVRCIFADIRHRYCDAYFPRTNLTKKCASWSNSGIPGSRIHGHWPGSAAHLTHVRREPR
jgi:hypothetical protein